MFKKRGLIYEFNKNKVLFFMILPAVVYFLVFAYIPMAGIIVAFKSYTYKGGLFFSPWAGFDNFKFFFTSGQAWIVTRNTFLFNITFMIVCNFLQILTAILLAEMAGKYYKKICQSVMFFPYFISWVVVGVFAYNLFNYEYGTINSMLKTMGMEPVNFYNTPGVWKYILVLFNSWKWIGYGSVMYLASIMGIDGECYEAAEIDGANVFQKIWCITLPMIKPTIIILMLLNLGRVLRGDFEMFYQLIGDNGQLFNATDVIDTFVFRSLISSNDIGMSSSAAFYQSIICFATIMIANSIVRRIEKDYALF